MSNHPNRSRHAVNGDPLPTPADIKAARLAAKLTQTEAAALVYRRLNSWQDWEAGNRHIDPGLWDLFNRRVAELIFKV